MRILTYSELIKIPTFEQRYEYLRQNGIVGQDTFGFDRYLNQMFYKSKEWKNLRNNIIVRDNACDLAMEGYDIPDRIYIHHINPLTKDDILNKSSNLMDPEYLICVSHATHNAIHYGDKSLLKKLITRIPGDTCPWK